MAQGSGLRGAFDALANFTIFIAAASLCVLVAVLTWQVIGRYALNDSPSWTEPVALILMSVAALFGAAVAVRRETHFNFPTLVELSPGPLHAALKALARLLTLASGAALAYYGGFLMIDAWGVPMAGAPAPEGLSYVGLCAGGVLIALFALERLLLGDARKDEG